MKADFDWPTEPGKITMAFLGSRGDLKQFWDRNNPDEVDEARAAFDRLVHKKKYLAFRVDKKGEKAEQIREFDPEIERMVLVPPAAGG